MTHNLNMSKKIFLIIVLNLMLILPGLVLAKSENASANSKGNQVSNRNVVNIGQVESVGNNKLVIEEKNKKNKIEAVIDKNTQISGKGRDKLNIQSINKKDKVAIISSDSGKEASKEAKRATKIFVKDGTASAQSKRRAVHGIITEINGLNITLAHQIHRDRIYNLVLTSSTLIKIKGIQDASPSALQVGQRIAAVGDLGANGVLIARRVHIIPGKAVGVFRKNPISTPSASLSPSPAASGSALPTSVPSASASAVPTATSSAATP